MSEQEIRDCPGPDAHPRRPDMPIPAGACDCHAHVFDATRYPYQPVRAYTPPDNGVDRLLALHAALGLSRGVVVQASVHGTDNRAALEAAAAHPDRLRAIVSVAEGVTEAEIAQMHAAGARGIRVNLVDRGGMPFRSLDALQAVADVIRPFGWHVELLVHVEERPQELRDMARRLGTPVCIGHAGYTKVARGGARHAGFRDFVAMLRDGLFWVKLTGLYRIAAEPLFPYADAHDMARAVLEAAPDRTVWGSDWPHPHHYDPMPDDGDMLGLLAAWAPEQALRNAVLTANPARLYDFPAS
ncbi:MAG TPA: amidohydrolase family protein [Falsiroseomonas sp.]|jgi:predicted TIM-barrel fold metal-dependent hydrolase|nr:amidohydrolase family protein [Falsiroseomonas sp.]